MQPAISVASKLVASMALSVRVRSMLLSPQRLCNGALRRPPPPDAHVDSPLRNANNARPLRNAVGSSVDCYKPSLLLLDGL